MRHNKVYLSVAQSRAWGKEWPIGDPYAFGKKEMPVVAVVGAIAGGIAGAGMIGTGVALFGGAVMSGTLIGGALIAGAALTTVGTITGNEKLAKWGGILSAVGGVSAGLAGAGAFGDAAQAGMKDAFSNGMSKISGAWDKVAGANPLAGADGLANTTANATSSTANAGSQVAKSSLNVNSDALNLKASSELSGTAGGGAASVAQPAVGGGVVGGDASGGTNYSLADAKPSLQSGASYGSSGQNLTLAAQQEKGGMLSGFWSGLDSGEKVLLGQGLMSTAQGVSGYLSGKEEAAALEKARAGEIERASNGPLIIDPNSPNRAEWETLAAQGKVGSIYFGVNQNAPSIKQPSFYDNPTLAQYQPGGTIMPPQVVAPRPAAPAAPRGGLLNSVR